MKILKLKEVLIYLILIIIFCLIYIKITYLVNEEDVLLSIQKYFIKVKKFELYFLSIKILKFIGMLLFSLLIKYEYFLTLKNTEGNYKINKLKFFCLCMPLLYFSLAEILYFAIDILLLSFLIWPLRPIMQYSYSLLPLLQVLFGTMFITSFYKENKI